MDQPKRRVNETPEAREHRLENGKRTIRAQRAKETPEQRRVRFEDQNRQHKGWHDISTLKQHETILQKRRDGLGESVDIMQAIFLNFSLHGESLAMELKGRLTLVCGTFRRSALPWD